jgi:hypothetical protein
LRAAAGQLYESKADIDYFPSFEIIGTPWSRGFFYDSNLRTVNPGGVEAVMRVFFDQHPPLGIKPSDSRPAAGSGDGEKAKQSGERKRSKERKDEDEVICEEELLSAFQR